MVSPGRPTRCARSSRRHWKAIGTNDNGAGNACSGDRRIENLARTEPAVVVHDVQHAEPPAVTQLVTDEVLGPSLHRPFWHRGCDAIPPGPLASLFGPNPQAMLGVEPIRALVVHNQAFPAQHGM